MVLGVRQMKICVTQIKRNSEKTSNPIDERLLGAGVPDQKSPHTKYKGCLRLFSTLCGRANAMCLHS